MKKVTNMKNVIIQFKVSAPQKERIDKAYVYYMQREGELVTFSEFLRRWILIDCEDFIQLVEQENDKKLKKE